MATYYDRYKRFRNDNSVPMIVPYIDLGKNSSDIVIKFKKSEMRMDTLSYKYYGSPDYGWLILMANPQYGSIEYEIPDGVSLRVPYPLDTALYRYEKNVNSYMESIAANSST